MTFCIMPGCGNPARGLYCDECLSARAEDGAARSGPPVPTPKPRAKQGHVPGEMNGIETRYAAVLEAQKRAGEIVDWGFEEIAFRIGKLRCWYRPDFWVRMAAREWEFVECKGAIVRRAGADRELHTEGRVKFEAAAQHFPWFGWRKVTWRDGAFVTLAHYPAKTLEAECRASA